MVKSQSTQVGVGVLEQQFSTDDERDIMIDSRGP